MTDLVLLIVIPVALLLLLIAARRRSPDSGRPYPDGSEYWVRLPKRALLDRCLSADDLEFVLGLRSRLVLHLLLAERRRLAREWLRQTRREALRLFRLHVRTARHASGLQPFAELKLFVSMTLFLLVYGAMAAVVSFYGPFQTRNLMGSLHVLANVLSNCGGRIAASISPAVSSQAHAGAGTR
jgi:hypothetical protein